MEINCRMVVGHTIQEAGINSACNDQVFRIDVGLSAGCGNGEPEVSPLPPPPPLHLTPEGIACLVTRTAHRLYSYDRLYEDTFHLRV
jgi:hypothetical protein